MGCDFMGSSPTVGYLKKEGSLTDCLYREYEMLKREIWQIERDQSVIIMLTVSIVSIFLTLTFTKDIYPLLLILPFIIFFMSFLYLGEMYKIIDISKYLMGVEIKIFRELKGNGMAWETYIHGCNELLHPEMKKVFEGNWQRKKRRVGKKYLSNRKNKKDAKRKGDKFHYLSEDPLGYGTKFYLIGLAAIYLLFLLMNLLAVSYFYSNGLITLSKRIIILFFAIVIGMNIILGGIVGAEYSRHKRDLAYVHEHLKRIMCEHIGCSDD